MASGVFSCDVWQHIIEVTDDVLIAVSVASTCRKLWRRFRHYKIIVSWKDASVRNRMKRACLQGNQRMVRVLLSHGARNMDWAMHCATMGGHRELVDLLEEFAKDKCDWNYILLGAAAGGHIELIEYCRDRGAYVSGLRGAAFGGQFQLFDALIERVANLYNLYNGLLGAAEGGQVRAAHFFIQKGAHVNDEVLGMVSRAGCDELVDLFIAKGAVVKSKAFCGAARGGHMHLIHRFEQLGEYGPPLDLMLCEAACGGNIDVMQWCLERGACKLESAVEEALRTDNPHVWEHYRTRLEK